MLPTRNKNEKKADFIDRCMIDPVMLREFPDAAQRRAICERQANAQGQAGDPRENHDFLNLTAEISLDLEAAGAADPEGKPRLPRFSMVAYTGGVMRLARWRYPVVVDLAGLAIPRQNAPIRCAHDQRIGHAQKIAIEDGKLIASGVISCTGQTAQEVVADAKNGFPWQASIGASVEQFEFVQEDKSVIVNGREFKGPVNVVRKATLGEISFVDIAADAATEARVAAIGKFEIRNSKFEIFEQEKNMDFTAWLKAKGHDPEKLDAAKLTELKAEFETEQEQKRTAAGQAPASGRDVDAIIAAAKAERERCRRISALLEEAVSTPGADIEALETLAGQATSERWPINTFELELLRQSRPKVRGGREVSPPPAPAGDVLEAAALLAVGHAEDGLVRSHGERTVEAAARRFGRNIGLQELILQCAQINGYTGRSRITPGNWREFVDRATVRKLEVQAAGGYSTVDLSGILGAVANKALAAVAAEPQWVAPLICGTASHSNFHTHTVYSLAVNGELLPVGPTGELKHMAAGEESYTRQVGTRGAVLRLSRTDVINDDLGVFDRNAGVLARKAYNTREKALFTIVNATGAGVSHFTAARVNYITGNAFGAADMAAAIKAFRNLKGPDGDPIMVEPALVLVPPSLEDEARRLLAAGSAVVMYGAGTTKSIGSSANIYAGRFGGAPLVSPWLENAKLTGASAIAWYLLASPAQYPCFEIAYLNGNETPTVEYFGLEAEADTLGMAWRVYWDFGVGTAEWRAGIKSAGA